MKEFRENIDRIDREIAKLLVERFDNSIKIRDYKKENQLPILNEKREEEVRENVAKYSDNYTDYILYIYEEILKQSKRAQEN